MNFRAGVCAIPLLLWARPEQEVEQNIQINVGDPAFFLLLAIVVSLFLIPRLLPRFIAGWKSVISPHNLKQRLESPNHVIMLDVRTATEYYGEQGHIKGAILCPQKRLAQMIHDGDHRLYHYRDSPVVAICRSGSRASFAARKLKRAGFQSVWVLAGGMNEWRNERYPVVLGDDEDEAGIS